MSHNLKLDTMDMVDKLVEVTEYPAGLYGESGFFCEHWTGTTTVTWPEHNVRTRNYDVDKPYMTFDQAQGMRAYYNKLLGRTSG